MNKLIFTGGATPAPGLNSSTQTLAVTATPRSLSLASISSEGSTESHLVEQEDIVTLSTAVRSFKEALSRLRRIFQPDRGNLTLIFYFLIRFLIIL